MAAGGTLKSLLVRLGVDSKKFDKGMDHAEKRTGTLQKSFKGLTNVGAGILAGAAVGIAAGTAALVSTIQPASDLEESINAVRVVFGDTADEILDFSETSSMAVGLSSRAFGQMSAEMGAMLGNVGIAEEDLATETINLMERASDMASIFNTDVSQAFGAIQSAIKGEFNPLEQFGVKMNMALINAKALSMGLVETSVDSLKVAEASVKLEKAIEQSAKATRMHGEDSLEARDAIIREAKAQAALEDIMGGTAGTITDSAKAQAALALVYEQTDKVAGDFQNTSDGLANSQRQLAGIVEDTKAKIGTGLQPALAGIAGIIKDIVASDEFQVFLDNLAASVTNLGNWITITVPKIIKNFKKFTNWLKNNQGIVVGVLAAMGVAVLAFGISVAIAAWTALVPLLPVIAIMLAVAAIAYYVYEAWTNNWGGIQEKVAAAKEAIMPIIQNLVDGIVAIWENFMTVINPIIEAFQAAFSGDWYEFGVKIREAWDAAWELVKETFANIKAWFLEVDWEEIGLNIIEGIANGIRGATSFLKEAAIKVVKAAWQAMKGFLGIESPSQLFADIGENMMMGMAQGIDVTASAPAVASVDAVQNIAVTAGEQGGGQGGMDEVRLARLIRDALLQVVE